MDAPALVDPWFRALDDPDETERENRRNAAREEEQRRRREEGLAEAEVVREAKQRYFEQHKDDPYFDIAGVPLSRVRWG